MTLENEYAAITAIFDVYKTATETYEADVKKYNDAVKAKNDALTAEEPPEEKPAPLPAKPSAPASPGVWGGLYMNLDTDFTVDSTYVPGDKVPIARRKPVVHDDLWEDGRRLAYMYTYADDSDKTYNADYAGHVYGRFGLLEDITQAPTRAATLIDADDTPAVTTNAKMINYL